MSRFAIAKFPVGYVGESMGTNLSNNYVQLF